MMESIVMATTSHHTRNPSNSISHLNEQANENTLVASSSKSSPTDVFDGKSFDALRLGCLPYIPEVPRPPVAVPASIVTFLLPCNLLHVFSKEFISNLEASSGVAVEQTDGHSADSSLFSVKLSGSDAAIRTARFAIAQSVEKDIQANGLAAGSFEVTAALGPDMLALLLGADGDTLKHIKAESGASIQVTYSSEVLGTTLIHFRGAPTSVLVAQELVAARLAPFAARQGIPADAVLHDPLVARASPDHESVVLSLTEADFWLLFIGDPHGLDALQARSGARVVLPAPGTSTAPGGYREVHLEGSPAQTRMAVDIIEQTLGRSSAPAAPPAALPLAQPLVPPPPLGLAYPSAGLDAWSLLPSATPSPTSSVSAAAQAFGALSLGAPSSPWATGATASTSTSTSISPTASAIWSDGSGSSPAMHTPLHNYAKTIRIPSGMIGFLIGRSGLTVRQIQEQTSTAISIAKEAGPGADFREITIAGEPSNVSRCENLIFEHITPQMVDASNPITSISIMVPDEKVGLVIGKRGAIIRQLQDQSHAKIFMPTGQAPEAPEKEIRVVGTSDQVAFARLLIQRCLAPKEVDDLPIDRELAPYAAKVQVPNDLVGFLIGTNGATVQKLEDETGVKLEIPRESKPGADHRVITICGFPKDVAICRSRIDEILQAVSQLNTELAAGNIISHVMQIPNSRVGIIIGKTGATVKALQDESGAKIVIPKESEDGLPYRSIAITGKPDAVYQLEQRIHALIQSQGLGGEALPGEAPRIIELFSVPNDKVGLIIGKGGATIRTIQMDSECKVSIPEECVAADTRQLTITGYNRANIEMCKRLIAECITQADAKADNPSSLFPTGTQVESVSVHVADNKVGLIIGKNGSTIRHLMDESGAVIYVPKECRPGETFREILVSGPPEAVQKCQLLIYQTITPWHEQRLHNGRLVLSTSDTSKSKMPESPGTNNGGASPAPGAISSSNSTTNSSGSVGAVLGASTASKVVYVPADRVGLIIGKSGSTIKQIKELTGASLHVSQGAMQPSSMREVTITGTEEQVQHCNAMIQYFLAPVPSLPPALSAQTARKGPAADPFACGGGLGKGLTSPPSPLTTKMGPILGGSVYLPAVGSPQLSASQQQHVLVPPPPQVQMHGHIVMHPQHQHQQRVYAPQQQYMQRAVQPPPSPYHPAQQQPPPSYGSTYGLPAVGAGMYQAVQPPVRMDVPTQTRLSIPHEKLAIVLGHNGNTLRQLQDQTGAQVFFAQPFDDTVPRSDILISGLGSQVTALHQLIKLMLNE